MKNHSPVPIVVKYLRQLRHSRMAVVILGITVIAECLLVTIPTITNSSDFEVYGMFTVAALVLPPLLLASILATSWYQDRSNPGCDPVSTTPLSPLAVMGGLNLVCLMVTAAVFLLCIPSLMKLFVNLHYGAIPKHHFFFSLALGILVVMTVSAALFVFPPSNIKGKNISTAMIFLVLFSLQPILYFIFHASNQALGGYFFLSRAMICITLWLYAFSIATSQCIPSSGNRRIWPRLMTFAMVTVLIPLIQCMSYDSHGSIGQHLYAEVWVIWSLLLIVIDLVTAVNDLVVPSQRILRNHASTPFRRIVSFVFAPGAINGWVFSALLMMFVSFVSFAKSHVDVTHICVVILFYAALAIFIKDTFVSINLSGFTVFSIIATVFIMPSFLDVFDAGAWCMVFNPFNSKLEAPLMNILTIAFAVVSVILLARPGRKLLTAWWEQGVDID